MTYWPNTTQRRFLDYSWQKTSLILLFTNLKTPQKHLAKISII